MGRAEFTTVGKVAAGRRLLRILLVAAFAMSFAAASVSIASAQGAEDQKPGLQKSGAQKNGTSLPAKTPAQGTEKKPTSLGVPPLRNLLIMIRTTLVALYQANITNNYSVLRDLGAPSFREANSVERLSAAFADLRNRGGDIAPVVLALPTLSKPATIDQNGMLRLTGAFDTRPNELAFDLVFQAVGGFWQLDGIAVQFRQPVAATSSETQPDEKATSGNPKKSAKHKKAPGKSKTPTQN